MKIFQMCKTYLIHYKWHLATYILITVLVSGLSILNPYLTGNFIDALVNGDGMGAVYRFCTIFAILTIIRLALSYVTSVMFAKMQMKMGYELNKDVLFHVQDLSLSFVNTNNSAYLNQTINNDSNAVIIFCITFIQNVLINSLILVATIYISFSINFFISSMLIVFVAIYAALYFFF